MGRPNIKSVEETIKEYFLDRKKVWLVALKMLNVCLNV
jgi:hypothetical protein